MSEGFSGGGCLRVEDAGSERVEGGAVVVVLFGIGLSTSGVAPLEIGRRAAMVMLSSSPFQGLQRTRLCWRLGQRDAPSFRRPGTVWRARARGDKMLGGR